MFILISLSNFLNIQITHIQCTRFLDIYSIDTIKGIGNHLAAIRSHWI